MDSQKKRGIAYLVGAYGVALTTAAAAIAMTPDWSPIARAALADVIGTLVVFAFSVYANNTSVYDPYWSVAPIALVGWWVLGPDGATGVLARQLIVLFLVVAWGVRLTVNFASGWPGLHHEDWRYVEQRRLRGRLFLLVSLTGLHMMPTVLVFLGCLGAYEAVIGDAPLNLLDLLGLVVTVGAIWVEALSDIQLRRFAARTDKQPGEIMADGLWAWSRHPNYLGENGFWWGLLIFGFAASGTAAAYASIGAITILLLFVFISIPMIDERHLERRPAYAEHAKKVPALFPRPPRK